MPDKDEQERKKAEWGIKEIRSLIDDGLESGLYTSHQETSYFYNKTYLYTKSGYQDFRKLLRKYHALKGETAAWNREKGSHSFFLGFCPFPEEGEDASQYGKGIMTLDIGRLFENTTLYYTGIEGGGMIIVRIIER